ncbi:MAG: Hsp20/alpha crystallin family protein [Planctomycetaceae bacterium]|nr:Hsp20/alpha crystallin family protein [Planctomycetales bacterium]MCB9924446.1 Hsp20/alpha crystallin family protein [Planctomycetaceae bacterium]
MLTRWQPYGDARTEMQRLHEEMNRLFGRYGRHTNGAREFSHGVYPPLNLWEDAGKLYIEAELPGFKLEDLDIYVTGENQLSIKGERKPLELREGTWHRQERGYGSFARIIELPNAVDSEAVEAEFKHGVLTITLPKRESAKPRRIEVKAN